MKTRKTLWITFGIFLLLLMLASGAALYCFAHPPKVKALMEKMVSRATGAAFSIERLNYSLNPMRIRAGGIVFRPARGETGVSAEIRDVMADCVLEGPFGRKTLIFKTLAVNGLNCRIREGAAAPSEGSGSKGGSFLSSMARYLISLLVFRDIRLEAARVAEGSVVMPWRGRKITVSDISGRLDTDHLIHMRGRVLVASPTEQATLSISDFHVDTTGAVSLVNPRVDVSIAFSGGACSAPEAGIENIQGRTSLKYDPPKQEVVFTGLNLTVEGARFPQTGTTPFDITLKAGGKIDLKKRKATVRGLSFHLGELLQLDGTLAAIFGDAPGFKLSVDKGRIFPGKWMSLPALGENLPALALSGPVDVEGVFSGGMKQGRWAFSCDMKGNLQKCPVSYRDRGMHLKGFAAGKVAVKGTLPRPDLSGELTGDRMRLRGKGVSLAAGKGTIRFSGTYPEFDIAEVSCGIPRVEFTPGKKTFSVTRLAINALKGRVNVLEKSLHLPAIRIKSSLLKNIQASFQMNGGRLRVTAKGKETGLLKAASTLKLLPPDWTFQGTDVWEVAATADGTGAASFSAGLALEKFHFQNPRETGAGENISLEARISGRTRSNPLTVKATAELTAGRGEVLMDRFYFDLGENTFFATFEGGYQGDHDRVEVDALSLGMKGLATARVTGAVSRKANAYEGKFFIHIPETPLEPPFQRLVREPFQTETPSLSTVRVGGLIGAEITLAGKPSRWVGKGVCTWKDGVVRDGDSGYGLTGIQLTLPLRLARKKDAETVDNPKGMLTVRSMRVPFLPEQALTIPLEAVQNGLRMPAVTTLAVPGGTLRVGPSRIIHLTGDAPEFHTALHFENLRLAQALSGLCALPVTGRADGHLDPIRVRGGQMESAGKIEAHVFGGTLTLSDVGASGVFTNLPVIHLNARWRHLNLAEMTRGTAFGKIEGILDGYAKDLEVSNGELQRFDLLLKTVETGNVPQKISVKAVDNIARLGGGQSPFSGVAGVFVSFFKEFPYRNIGVHATLENDVFRIRGTLQEDGKEYLVKRGFFSGVDVINQSRDNRVGFKDMLKRIRRISDSKRGPVIR